MTTLVVKVRSHFDPGKIIRESQRKQRRLYSRSGAYIRRVARNSIKQKPKKKKYVPEAGKPPRAKDRKKSRYRNGILYAIDERTNSMVVGPAARGPVNTAWVFETGGTIQIYASPVKRNRRKRVRAKSQKQREAYLQLIKEGRITPPNDAKKERKKVQATFRKFPVMGPAAEASRPKLSSLFAQL